MLVVLSFILINYNLLGRGRLCAGDIDNLRNWKFSPSNEDNSLLTRSGELEMYHLGER